MNTDILTNRLTDRFSRHLLVAVLLGCGWLLQACSADGDESFSQTTVGRAFVSMSFSTQGSRAGTRASDPHIKDNGIEDVLQEGSTVNESQIHTVLVALFTPAGTDAEKQLQYLFWFVDNSAPLLEVLDNESAGASALLPGLTADHHTVMGALTMDGAKIVSNSSVKAVWPGNYHTIVYGNMLSPRLCMSLVGAASLPALMAMTQDEIAAQGISLQTFKQRLTAYATGPLSDVGTTGQPSAVLLRDTPVGYVRTDMLGGYSDQVGTGLDFYQQSTHEDSNLHIPRGYSESAPLNLSFAMRRALAKIRVNMTNIDEAGNIYDGTDEYWISSTDGIQILNWIPFGPGLQWKDYPIAAAAAYDVSDGLTTATVTGYATLNVSRMQQNYPATLPLQYYLTQRTRDYIDGGTPKQVDLQTGAIEGSLRTSTDPLAYNAELFDCYIAPWSTLFDPQSATTNATAIRIKMEKRDSGNAPIAGTERVYTIPLYNPTTDPVVATVPLIDTHTYLPDGTYTNYTILRNYLYQVDVVFMGPAGLLWKIKAIPDDWVDDGDVELDMNI